MKKKHIIILSASLLSAMAVGVGIVGITPKAAQVKAEGKEKVLFNITTYQAMNPTVALFDLDQTMPTSAETPNFEWLVDGVKKTTSAQLIAGEKLVYINWSGSKLADDDIGYHHFRLDAGTVVFENDTTQYVLENDYNFWMGRQSGGANGASWVFQHGTKGAASEIPSFSVEDSTEGGAQSSDDCKRWLLKANYTKSSEWQVNVSGLWCAGQYFYAMGDSTDYTLRYNGVSSDSTAHYFELATAENGLAHSTSLTGSEYFLMYFSPFGTTTGVDQFISFYFPRGTLFGGYNTGYSCFLENDYYITVLKGRVFGTTQSTADLIYSPVQSFIDTNMKMDDTAYDGAGTGLCKDDGVYAAAKTAYTNLTDNQKFTFCNYSDYGDASQRLNAWAAANGDTLNSVTGALGKASTVSLVNNGNGGNTTLYVATFTTAALLVITVGSVFYYRKKHQN